MITVTKLTSAAWARTACQYTRHDHGRTNIELDTLYRCEHSPIRTQIFALELRGIPSFVSVHFVRHKIGVEHFVQTMRDDRGAADTADRMTPVNHLMIANAQALINMARKRLCGQAHPTTQLIMAEIREGVGAIDPDLARYMVPECVYRGGVCYERAKCGKGKHVQHWTEVEA